VQQLLGHKTIRTTMRYSHVHPTELREAVNKLGEKIASAGAGRGAFASQPVGTHSARLNRDGLSRAARR
jgi:hypothetical protein